MVENGLGLLTGFPKSCGKLLPVRGAEGLRGETG